MIVANTPEMIDAFAALSIRAQLRLIKIGMKNSRLTKTQILAAATRYTERRYTTRDLDLAIADLTAKYRIIV